MGTLMLDALEIGYAIKDARLEFGLTQAQLAGAAGISERCLWSLELGRSPGVQLDKLLAVFKVLGLDLQIVVGKAPASEASEERVKGAHVSSGSDAEIDALSILTGGQNGVA